MCKRKVLCAIFAAAMFLNGCAGVRTYTEDKERVDQILTEGNQGYLAGHPKEGEVPHDRKMTRRTYVTEIELGLPHKKRAKVLSPSGALKKEVVEEAENAPILQEGAPREQAVVSAAAGASYTVEPNDTLQKISQKVYGTAKKWKKIFDANADKLKSPDRIYAGQVLKIPQE